MPRLTELRMVVRIAQMYHVEGHRQADIAEHLRISQATVSRMLKRALREKIVRMTVVGPAGTYAELETALRTNFGLSEAVVVECPKDRDDAVMDCIGEAAAHFVEATLQVGEIIGVSGWSETVLKMVDNIYPTKAGKAKYVLQTLGGMGDPTVELHANQLTTRLASLTGAEARLLCAPGVAKSRAAKHELLGDTDVREIMDMFGEITLAIVGIGAMESSDMLAGSGNILSSRELAAIAKAGGIGHINLRFFDANGGFVKTPLDERVIGMSLEELSRNDRVIALAGGQSKTGAIRGALKTGVVDILITDKFTASRLVGQGDRKEAAAR